MATGGILRSGLVIVLMAGSGCYSAGPYRYVGYDSNATVVVYRPSSVNLPSASAYLSLDDDVVAELRQDAYVEIPLAPGAHRLKVNASGYPRADVVEFEIADLQRLHFEAVPSPMDAAATAASVAAPAVIALGAAIGAMFTPPFALEARTEDDFRKVVDDLERVQIPAGPPSK